MERRVLPYRWLGHPSRTPPLRGFQVQLTGGLKEDHGTRWRKDFVSKLTWENIRFPLEELEQVERGRFGLLCPRDPSPDKQ